MKQNISWQRPRRAVFSLRDKIVLIFVTGFIVLTILFLFAAVFFQQSFLNRTSKVYLTGLVQSFAVSARPWVLASDVVGLQELLHSISTYPDISYAMVISKSGRVLAHSDTSRIGLYLADSTSRRLLEARPEILYLDESFRFIDIAIPIVSESLPVAWVRVGIERREILQNVLSLILGGGLFLLFSAGLSFLASYFLSESLSRELDNLASAAESIKIGRRDIRAPGGKTREISRLSDSINNMLDTLIEGENELHALNQHLTDEVKEQVTQNRSKDLMLIQQSRLAAMGEMLHNIAHQWRQPLNSISLVVATMEDEMQYGELNKENMERHAKKIYQLITAMSRTIDDFRNFFRPDKQPEDFNISESVRSALSLMEISLKHAGIHVETELPQKAISHGYPNQFAHAILNLISNARDAVKALRSEGGWIRIAVQLSDSTVELEVSDNGTGIPQDILERIFDPYFTTKKTGSGIGLYMTRMIVENTHGTVVAGNTPDGALVRITLPRVL